MMPFAVNKCILCAYTPIHTCACTVLCTVRWVTLTFNIYAHFVCSQGSCGSLIYSCTNILCLNLYKLICTSLFFLIIVPTPVNDLDATAFGITCINVTWSGPDELRGNDEIYFVTFSDGSSDMTLNESSNFFPLTDINPGLNYSIEVCTCTSTCSNPSSIMLRRFTLPWFV